MFYHNKEDEYTELIPGIRIKTLVHGDKTLTARFILEKGSSLPLHNHPHEQTGYLVAGRMEFTIDGKSFLAEPGDSWCIKGEVMHGAEVLEESIVIEVFSPLRHEYLPEQLLER